MTKDEAREAAERLLRDANWTEFTAKFVGIKVSSRDPNMYGVVFDVYAPEGHVVDGPVVIVVDQRTGEARFLSEM